MSNMTSYKWFKIICIILIVSFITLDITWAYPNDNSSHTSTLGLPMVSAPLTAETAATRAGITLEGLSCTIAHCLFTGTMRLNTVADIMRKESAANAGVVDLDHINAVVLQGDKLRTVGLTERVPTDAIVLIPYDRYTRKRMLLIARNDNPVINHLPGYIIDKNLSGYLIKDLPKDFDGITEAVETTKRSIQNTPAVRKAQELLAEARAVKQSDSKEYLKYRRYRTIAAKLAAINNPIVRGILTDAVRDSIRSNNSDLLPVAAMALSRMRDPLSRTIAGECLIQAYSSYKNTPVIVDYICNALLRIGDVRGLVALLNDFDFGPKAAARLTDMKWDVKSAPIEDQVAYYLASRNPYGLANIPGDAALNAIIKSLGNRYTRYRDVAAMALGIRKDPRAVPALCAALNDGINLNVLTNIARALDAIGSPYKVVVQGLIRIAADPYAEAESRMAAIEALNKRNNDPKVVRMLLDISVENIVTEPNVRFIEKANILIGLENSSALAEFRVEWLSQLADIRRRIVERIPETTRMAAALGQLVVSQKGSSAETDSLIAGLMERDKLTIELGVERESKLTDALKKIDGVLSRVEASEPTAKISEVQENNSKWPIIARVAAAALTVASMVVIYFIAPSSSDNLALLYLSLPITAMVGGAFLFMHRGKIVDAIRTKILIGLTIVSPNVKRIESLLEMNTIETIGNQPFARIWPMAVPALTEIAVNRNSSNSIKIKAIAALKFCSKLPYLTVNDWLVMFSCIGNVLSGSSDYEVTIAAAKFFKEACYGNYKDDLTAALTRCADPKAGLDSSDKQDARLKAIDILTDLLLQTERGSAAIEVLKSLLSDRSPAVRNLASSKLDRALWNKKRADRIALYLAKGDARRLSEMGAKAYPYLMTAIAKSPREIVNCAIEAMRISSAKDSVAFEMLVLAFGNPMAGENTYITLANVMTGMKDRGGVSGLIHAVNYSRYSRARAAAVDALLRIDNFEAILGLIYADFRGLKLSTAFGLIERSNILIRLAGSKNPLMTDITAPRGGLRSQWITALTTVKQAMLKEKDRIIAQQEELKLAGKIADQAISAYEKASRELSNIPVVECPAVKSVTLLIDELEAARAIVAQSKADAIKEHEARVRAQTPAYVIGHLDEAVAKVDNILKGLGVETLNDSDLAANAPAQDQAASATETESGFASSPAAKSWRAFKSLMHRMRNRIDAALTARTLRKIAEMYYGSDRGRAIEMLVTKKSDVLTDTLVELVLIPAKNRETSIAIDILCRKKDPRIIAPLLDALHKYENSLSSDYYADVMGRIKVILLSVYDERVIGPVFIPMLDNSYWAFEAADCLEQMEWNPEADGVSTRTRMNYYMATGECDKLAAMQGDEVTAHLVERLYVSEDTIRNTAIDALVIKGDGVVPALVSELEIISENRPPVAKGSAKKESQDTGNDEIAGYRIVEILSRINTEKAVAGLATALRSSYPEIRNSAERFLAMKSTEQSLSILIDRVAALAKSTDIETLVEAANILTDIKYCMESHENLRPTWLACVKEVEAALSAALDNAGEQKNSFIKLITEDGPLTNLREILGQDDGVAPAPAIDAFVFTSNWTEPGPSAPKPKEPVDQGGGSATAEPLPTAELLQNYLAAAAAMSEVARTVPATENSLADGSLPVRSGVLGVFKRLYGWMKAQIIVRALLWEVTDVSTSIDSQDVVDTLIPLRGKSVTNKLVSVILTPLDNPSDLRRYAHDVAEQVLIRQTDAHPRLVGILLEALPKYRQGAVGYKSSYREVARRIENILLATHDVRIIGPVLIPMLQNEGRRHTAATTLDSMGWNPDADGVDLETRMDYYFVKRDAGKLAAIEGDEVLVYLIKDLDAISEDDRATAAAALVMKGDGAVPALVNELEFISAINGSQRSQEYDIAIGRGVVDVLTSINTPAAIDGLATALRSAYPDIRSAARIALRTLNTEASISILLKDLSVRDNYRTEYIMEAARSLIILEHSTTINGSALLKTKWTELVANTKAILESRLGQTGDDLQDLLEEADEPERTERHIRAEEISAALPEGTVTPSGQTFSREELSYQLAGLADPDASVRALAARQLGNMKDARAVEFLLEALKIEKDDSAWKAIFDAFQACGETNVLSYYYNVSIKGETAGPAELTLRAIREGKLKSPAKPAGNGPTQGVSGPGKAGYAAFPGDFDIAQPNTTRGRRYARFAADPSGINYNPNYRFRMGGITRGGLVERSLLEIEQGGEQPGDEGILVYTYNTQRFVDYISPYEAEKLLKQGLLKVSPGGKLYVRFSEMDRWIENHPIPKSAFELARTGNGILERNDPLRFLLNAIRSYQYDTYGNLLMLGKMRVSQLGKQGYIGKRETERIIAEMATVDLGLRFWFDNSQVMNEKRMRRIITEMLRRRGEYLGLIDNLSDVIDKSAVSDKSIIEIVRALRYETASFFYELEERAHELGIGVRRNARVSNGMWWPLHQQSMPTSNVRPSKGATLKTAAIAAGGALSSYVYMKESYGVDMLAVANGVVSELGANLSEIFFAMKDSIPTPIIGLAASVLLAGVLIVWAIHHKSGSHSETERAPRISDYAIPGICAVVVSSTIALVAIVATHGKHFEEILFGYVAGTIVLVAASSVWAFFRGGYDPGKDGDRGDGSVTLETAGSAGKLLLLAAATMLPFLLGAAPVTGKSSAISYTLKIVAMVTLTVGVIAYAVFESTIKKIRVRYRLNKVRDQYPMSCGDIINKLASMDGNAVTDALISALSDTNKAVCAVAAAAIGLRQDRRAAQALLEAFKAEDYPPARIQIMNALCNIGNKEIIPQLLPLLKDPERRKEVSEILSSLGWNPASSDVTLETKIDYYIATNGVASVVAIGNSKYLLHVLNHLMFYVGDVYDCEKREFAINAIVSMAEGKQAEEVVNILKVGRWAHGQVANDLNVYAGIIETLKRIGTDEAINTISSSLYDDREGISEVAANALISTDTEKAVDHLMWYHPSRSLEMHPLDSFVPVFIRELGLLTALSATNTISKGYHREKFIERLREGKGRIGKILTYSSNEGYVSELNEMLSAINSILTKIDPAPGKNVIESAGASIAKDQVQNGPEKLSGDGSSPATLKTAAIATLVGVPLAVNHLKDIGQTELLGLALFAFLTGGVFVSIVVTACMALRDWLQKRALRKGHEAARGPKKITLKSAAIATLVGLPLAYAYLKNNYGVDLLAISDLTKGFIVAGIIGAVIFALAAGTIWWIGSRVFIAVNAIISMFTAPDTVSDDGVSAESQSTVAAAGTTDDTAAAETANTGRGIGKVVPVLAGLATLIMTSSGYGADGSNTVMSTTVEAISAGRVDPASVIRVIIFTSIVLVAVLGSIVKYGLPKNLFSKKTLTVGAVANVAAFASIMKAVGNSADMTGGQFTPTGNFMIFASIVIMGFLFLNALVIILSLDLKTKIERRKTGHSHADWIVPVLAGLATLIMASSGYAADGAVEFVTSNPDADLKYLVAAVIGLVVGFIIRTLWDRSVAKEMDKENHLVPAVNIADAEANAIMSVGTFITHILSKIPEDSRTSRYGFGNLRKALISLKSLSENESLSSDHQVRAIERIVWAAHFSETERKILKSVIDKGWPNLTSAGRARQGHYVVLQSPVFVGVAGAVTWTLAQADYGDVGLYMLRTLAALVATIVIGNIAVMKLHPKLGAWLYLAVVGSALSGGAAFFHIPEIFAFAKGFLHSSPAHAAMIIATAGLSGMFMSITKYMHAKYRETPWFGYISALVFSATSVIVILKVMTGIPQNGIDAALFTMAYFICFVSLFTFVTDIIFTHAKNISNAQYAAEPVASLSFKRSRFAPSAAANQVVVGQTSVIQPFAAPQPAVTATEAKGTILVTGGAGYIGSHTVRALLKQGYDVVILDNLVKGRQFAIDRNKALAQELGRKLVDERGDLGDTEFVNGVFSRNKAITKVVHFAAFIEVGESNQRTALYYQNNIANTLTLLDAMAVAGVKKIVFSSSAATYGSPDKMPITEDTPTNPINPYGYTKLAMERMIEHYHKAFGMEWIALRYFNASGASRDGELGETHSPESHLIPRIFDMVSKGQEMTVYGTDYPTDESGTNIRDYVHVEDLADAHIRALEAGTDVSNRPYNLGTGKGFSVMQIIEKAGSIMNMTPRWKDTGRRAGDPVSLVASSDDFQAATGWELRYSDINTVLETAWAWYQNRPTEAQESKPLPDISEDETAADVVRRVSDNKTIPTYLKDEILTRLERDRKQTEELFDIVEHNINNDRALFIIKTNNLIRFIDSLNANSEDSYDINPLHQGSSIVEIMRTIRAVVKCIETEVDANWQSNPEVVESLKLLRDEKRVDQLEANGIVGDLVILGRETKRRAAKDAQNSGQKRCIAIETEWVPGCEVASSQQRKAKDLLEAEIKELQDGMTSMNMNSVEIIYGSADELEKNLVDRVAKGQAKLSEVVVLASSTTVARLSSNTDLQSKTADDKPFMAEIDPANLTSFVGSTEDLTRVLNDQMWLMLSITLDLAVGKQPPKLPIIAQDSYDPVNRRIRFLPAVVEIKWEELPSRHKAVMEMLRAA